MDAGDRGKVGARRGIARQHLKRLALERAFDRAQAIGPLGMALAHVMREARGMRDDERGRVFAVLRSDLLVSRVLRRTSRASARESPLAITAGTGVWFGPNLRSGEPAMLALSRAKRPAAERQAVSQTEGLKPTR